MLNIGITTLLPVTANPVCPPAIRCDHAPRHHQHWMVQAFGVLVILRSAVCLSIAICIFDHC